MKNIIIEIFIICPYFFAMSKAAIWGANDYINDNPELKPYKYLIEFGYFLFWVGLCCLPLLGID